MVKSYRKKNNKKNTRKHKGGIFGKGFIKCGDMTEDSLKKYILGYVDNNDVNGLTQYINCRRIRSNPFGTWHVFGQGEGERKNNEEILKRKQSLTNIVDLNGRNVLHIALCHGNLEMVKFLMSNFQSPTISFLNKPNKYGLTPLDDFYTRGLITTNINDIKAEADAKSGGIMFYNCSNVYTAISAIDSGSNSTHDTNSTQETDSKTVEIKSRNASLNELKSIENELFSRYRDSKTNIVSLKMNIKTEIVGVIEEIMKQKGKSYNFPTFSYK